MAHVRNYRRVLFDEIIGRRLPRVFKDRSNPLEELNEREVFIRYRFRPATIMFILASLQNVTQLTLRSFSLPPLLQLLVCLRFFATGSFQIVIGDTVNISRSTAGKCIRHVARSIANIIDQFVQFPSGERLNVVKRAFYSSTGFPNVIGAIDCTHVRLQRPLLNEQDYVNRKGFHSLNVQMCCDHEYRITSVCAKWPGSVHDSRIFRDSALSAQFLAGQHDGLLLGDSGYPCKPYLMTPLLNPTTDAELKFNDSLCKSRVKIEQTFGIFKRRFHCLHVELRTSPQQAITYISACAVLHNIGIEQGDIINFQHVDIIPEELDITDIAEQHIGPNDGMIVRNRIIQTFFQ